MDVQDRGGLVFESALNHQDLLLVYLSSSLFEHFENVTPGTLWSRSEFKLQHMS